MSEATSGLPMFGLKRLGARNLQSALDKAEQYRALNEPEEAESICRDILAEAPDHQLALRTLGLSLTDQFDRDWASCFDDAIATFGKLTSEYEVVYYKGVAWERLAKAHIHHGQFHNAAHAIENALEYFADAERVGPTDAPDPILRWNRCVRAIKAYPELIAALREPHTHEFQHGD